MSPLGTSSRNRPVLVPHGFYAGLFGKKVHLGVERRGDVVRLACGMSGVAFGDGKLWLYAVDLPVTCGSCKKSTEGRRFLRADCGVTDRGGA